MRIGIVTQPLLGNYGGLLQNYALQTVLKKLGHQPITIDYIWNLRLHRYVHSCIKTIAMYLIPSRRRQFTKWHAVRTNKVIDTFVNKYISKTDYVYRYSPSLIDKLQLDAVITGSDQVWRPIYNANLKDLYLDFARDKDILKIAYGASFGTSEHEYTQGNISFCKKAAKRLDAVSVRESSGIQLCRDYFGIEATAVLDPTLLLSVDDYLKLSADVPLRKGKFVVTYILDYKPEYDRLIQNVCDLNGLSDIISVAVNDENFAPQDWIALIRDASFVVTDSFHATVFSIIFHKPFLSICNHERGADRFISLLKPLGLLDRLVDDISQNLDILSQPIDWDKVDKLLDNQRKKSIDFLTSSLALSKLS